ncbi:hypothetical protein Taro_017102, partial [Colocasia esculenta]|nr:hypothetical protein [Colocasia esculenta]
MEVIDTGAPISVPGINNIAEAHEGLSIFSGVGKRLCEGNDLYMEMKESGVINEQNIAESKEALIYGQMNEPLGARMRVGLTALTMAEYFRDVNEQDILLFIDNLFRFIQAGYFLPYWGECLLQWVINPSLVQKEVLCRK